MGTQRQLNPHTGHIPMDRPMTLTHSYEVVTFQTWILSSSPGFFHRNTDLCDLSVIKTRTRPMLICTG